MPAFYPSIDGLTGQELIAQLNSSKLTLQANLKAGERIHNSGLLDNRKFFVKNGIAKDEQYVLRITYNAAGALKGFIAFYDGFAEDGKYNIRKDTNGNEIHIFDFVTKVTDAAREDYNIYVNKANVAVTYQEMLTGKLGLFLEASQDDNYIIESVYLFKYYTYINNNGEELIVHPETVPSNLIKTIYSFILSILSIILAHEYPFYPVQLSLIGAFCVGIPSFFLALEPNYTKVKKGFMVKVFRNALISFLHCS